MPINTFRITLRADIPTDAVPAMEEIVRQFARQLQSSVVLLNKGRYPATVTADRTDTMFNRADIHLSTDDATFEDGDPS